MIKIIFTNIYQKICLAFFMLLIFFWFFINFFTKTTSGFNNNLFAMLYGIMPIIAGLVGIFNAKCCWGGLKSVIGKSILFIGFGIFSFGIGEMIWSYYNFSGIDVPYPSLADVGFVFNAILSNLGIIYLASAIGARYGLRNKNTLIFIIISTILVSIFSYYLLVQVARGGAIISDRNDSLKAFLDIFYPLSDFFALITVIIVSGLSFKYIGGKYLPSAVAILLGTLLMFFADFSFSYTTTTKTFYNGNWVDLLFASALFFTSFGILGFTKIKNL